MDIYTQLQDKIKEMSERITQETGYFQENPPKDPDETRLPLLGDAFEETRASLAVRAQVDKLLGTLPTDEGEEAVQQVILEALVEDNMRAGQELQEETESAERMLERVRGAIKEMGDDRSRDCIEQLALQKQRAVRGLVSNQLVLDPPAYMPNVTRDDASSVDAVIPA